MPRLPLRGRRSARTDVVSDEETRAHVAGAASAAAAEVAVPPVIRPDLTGAAFFDVDNTMMMGASLFWFARGLAARKYFTSRDLMSFFWQQAKFRIAGNESADDMHTIRENALAFVAGRPGWGWWLGGRPGAAGPRPPPPWAPAPPPAGPTPPPRPSSTWTTR